MTTLEETSVQEKALTRIRYLTDEYHPGSTDLDEALSLARAFIRPSTVLAFQAASKRQPVTAEEHRLIAMTLDARLRMEGVMAELLEPALGDVLDTWDAMLDTYGDALAILTPEEYGEATRIGAFCAIWTTWRENDKRHRD